MIASPQFIVGDGAGVLVGAISLLDELLLSSSDELLVSELDELLLSSADELLVSEPDELLLSAVDELLLEILFSYVIKILSLVLFVPACQYLLPLILVVILLDKPLTVAKDQLELLFMFIDEPSHGSILSLSQTSSILQKIPALF